MNGWLKTLVALGAAAAFGAAYIGGIALSERNSLQTGAVEHVLPEVRTDTLLVTSAGQPDPGEKQEAAGWRVSIEYLSKPTTVSIDSILSEDPLSHLNQPRTRYFYDLVRTSADSALAERVIIETYDSNHTNLIPSKVTILIDLDKDKVPDFMHYIDITTGETISVTRSREGKLLTQAEDAQHAFILYDALKNMYPAIHSALYPVSKQGEMGKPKDNIAMFRK